MLTEKALLADAQKNYMSDAQLDFFKHLLMQLKKQVEENLHSFRDTIAENEIEPDPLDFACMEEIKQISLIGVRRDTELLHEIEASLERIRNRDYGFCEETGEAIGIRRLLANPNATLSVEALENRESMERIQGNSMPFDPV